MTPGDVMDAIIADDRITHWGGILSTEPDQCAQAIIMWGHIQHLLRPDGPWHTPLSPSEIEHLRVSLRTILDALNVAHQRSPEPMYVVKEGGR